MVPAFSLLCLVLFFDKKRRFGEWIVFSLHYYSFDFGVSTVLAIPLLLAPESWQVAILQGIIVCLLLCLGYYLSRALVRAFQISRRRAFLSAILMLLIDMKFTNAVHHISTWLITLPQ